MTRFITFEGIDGSGKSTQLELLVKKLKKMKKKVIVLREPGGNDVSENIRNILLNKENNITPEAEMMLFLAARSQMTNEIIKPAIENGTFVICDRYADSTLAYQGYGRKIDTELVHKLNEFVTSGIEPGCTFYLDIDTEETNRRKKGETEDRMESLGPEFMDRVRKGYLSIAGKNPERIMVLDGYQDMEILSDQIWKKMQENYTELK